jgi:TolA-binding protein
VTESHTEFERWAQLVDRQADDQVLSAEELAFCRAFEQTHPMCGHELAAYAQLADLGGAPNDASRALVDRALQQLEAEEAAHAVAEVRLLRRPRFANWLGLAAAVLVGLGTAYALRATRSTDTAVATASLESSNKPAQPLARAELVYASGNVTVAGAHTGVGRTLLTDGSVIETAEGGACVLIDSDINLCLAAHSRMRLTAIAVAARQIELEAGKLATRLATQPEGMSLSIVADGVASTVVGTAYAVERMADHSVVTTVLNGKVRVGRGTSTVLVNAHERAVSRSDGADVSSVSRTDESPSWALLGPTVLWHDPVAATLDVRGTPLAADIWLDEQMIGIAPLSSLIPIGQHRLVVRKGTQELAARELYVHAGGSEEVVYDASVTASAPGPAQPRVDHVDHIDHNVAKHSANVAKLKASLIAATKNMTNTTAKPRLRRAVRSEPAVADTANAEEVITAADWLRRARQAMRAERFTDASLAYETVIKNYGHSDEAQAALVLLGQLRLTQLHDARGALEVLNAYLKQGGSLEVEARVARIEALHQLKRSAEEAAAIDEFLQRHPRSFEAKALRARSATPGDSQ